MALLYNRKPFIFSLWASFGCGFLIDLVSTEPRLGLYAINFALTTLALYPQRRHFFEDKELSLSFFTALISTVSTLVHLVLLQIFGKGIPFKLSSLFTDLILMPLFDGLYAFLWFTSPLKLYTYGQKVGWRNLFKNLKETDDV